MKITNIKVIVTCLSRNCVLLKIETDEGIYWVSDTTPNLGVQECIIFRDQIKEAIPDTAVFKDSYLTVSDTPGLGCDINEELAKKYPYQRAYLPVVRRLGSSVQDL